MGAATNPENSGARDFYRDRLADCFRCSRRLSQALGRVAEDVAGTADSANIMRECAAGSFEAARRIGELAVVYLDAVPVGVSGGMAQDPATRSWWRELLNYERGCFLQAATTAENPPANRPRRGVSSTCMSFSWDAPELAERLQADKAITPDLQRPVTLLFARTRDGQVRVVEVGTTVEKVFRATNGLRTLEQIAQTAGLSDNETSEVLQALASIGAIVPAMSQEEMMRALKSGD